MNKKGNSNKANQSRSLNKSIRKQSRDSDSSCSEKRYGKFWKPSEDQQLIELHLKYNGNWKMISSDIYGRSASQCQQRWKRINPNKSKLRKQWSDEEDKEVLRLVELHGRNWKTIEQCMNGRTSKQIRERFLNNLDPEINREKFTELEDQIILQQYKIYGPKWSEIAKNLDRRPENQVKNRFYSYIKRVSKLSDDDEEDDDEQMDEEEEFEMPQKQQQQQQIQLETIHSQKDEENNNTRNDSFLNTRNDSFVNARNDSFLNQTPSNRNNHPLINLIQDSFEEQYEVSPFNQQRRIQMDYSPINFQQAHQQLTFAARDEEFRELKNQLESINFDHHH